MNMKTRIAKLEDRSPPQIPVWCDDLDDVPATIDAMVLAGEISDADRSRCLHWSNVVTQGRHERALGLFQ